MVENYQKIRSELKNYDLSLYKKRELVFFNKSDLLKKDEINKKISEFKSKIKEKIQNISIFRKNDIQAIKRTLVKNVNK